MSEQTTQVPGAPATVSGAAIATGGIAPGNFIETDIDDRIVKFQSEDTPLMTYMLKARRVKVNSPEVDHFILDDQRSVLTTDAEVEKDTNKMFFVLNLVARDQNVPREYHTLLVNGVPGYDESGSVATPGRDLMLFVIGRDTATNNPVVRAVNGPKNSPTDMYCYVPNIPSGTRITLLANAMYETQKEVDPDLVVPQPERVYLQKRGMNQIVSDYFEAQRKHIPFSQSVIAEQALIRFKRAGNLTLWAGRKGKITMSVPKLGDQFVYFTEGLRWQFKRELVHGSNWTIEDLIALAKMFYTGDDMPKSATLLAGKNLLEALQRIDFRNHPEIQVMATTNTIGWSVTRVHTVFGNIDIKREPTLDTLGWSNSGALLGEDRLVHYTYSAQHTFEDRVEGEEATRQGLVVWDGLALKGSCHIWIDGEGDAEHTSAAKIVMWGKPEAPDAADLVAGRIYYLTADCPAIGTGAVMGTMWTYDGAVWKQYEGVIKL